MSRGVDLGPGRVAGTILFTQNMSCGVYQGPGRVAGTFLFTQNMSRGVYQGLGGSQVPSYRPEHEARSKHEPQYVPRICRVAAATGGRTYLDELQVPSY